MKFLVPNYGCVQNPQLGGYPRSLCPLSSTEFVETPPNKIPGYAIVPCNMLIHDNMAITGMVLQNTLL